MKTFTGRGGGWRNKFPIRRGASNPIVPDVSNVAQVLEIPDVPRVPEVQPSTEIER